MRRLQICGVVVLAAGCWPAALAGQSVPVLEPPPKPVFGTCQIITPACTVETDTSKSYADKVARMIRSAEIKFYTLFKLTPELMNGASREKFDAKTNIPGTIMTDMGFRPWIDVRIYKDYQPYADEFFELTNVKDKQARLTQGVPGAYFSISPDYEKKKMLRRIRSYVANRDDDELERTLLHEMGHLFMSSYLLEFAGNPPPGQEAQKRGTPAWLGEGLAQFFETRWSNAASAKKASLRQQAMIYEAAQLGDVYGFEEFINITNAHNLAAVAKDPLKATLNYAQSASVMDYMVNIDGARFMQFLQKLRELNFQRNLFSRDKNHVPELYSFQNEAFRSAFQADIKQVEDYWKKHIKKSMEDQLKRQPELYYWIGEYYLRRRKDPEKDLAKAEEKFALALKLAPNKGEGYLGMGRMAIRKKQNDEAVKLLAKAAELMPKDDDVWYYHGVSLMNTGKHKEACESFSRALKIFNHNSNALAGLAQAAFQTAQYEKAMDSYEEAYVVSRNPYFLFEKGYAAFFAKKYREAQTGFALFSEMFPKDANAHAWYGLAAWRLGDKEFALKKFNDALAVNPKHETALSALQLAQKGETLRFALEGADPKDPKSADAAKTPAGAKPQNPVRIEDE